MAALGAVVEAYEAALARDGAAALADFTPHPDHPDRLTILCELVRVDLEHRWTRGQPPRLEDYQELFPALFEDRDLLHAMAYEEYRLRQQAGERPKPADYLRRFGLEGGEWPPPPEGQVSRAAGRALHPPPVLSSDHAEGMDRAAMAYRAYRREGTGDPEELSLVFHTLHVPPEQAELLSSLDRIDPHAAERLADAVTGLPNVGMDFLGFRLCDELGRGAFGRVFLARQGDMADRLVALKISADVVGEMRALAQLQHTNIVSIYSVHRSGPLQAVCMPYLGATTLADTISGLRSQAALPVSGEGLLSTIRSRKTAVAALQADALVNPTGGDRPDQISGQAAPPEFDHQPQMLEPAPSQIEQFAGWAMCRPSSG